MLSWRVVTVVVAAVAVTVAAERARADSIDVGATRITYDGELAGIGVGLAAGFYAMSAVAGVLVLASGASGEERDDGQVIPNGLWLFVPVAGPTIWSTYDDPRGSFEGMSGPFRVAGLTATVGQAAGVLVIALTAAGATTS